MMIETPAPDPVEAARLLVAHDEGPHVFSAVVPPIVQTSLFTFASYDEMVAAYRGEIVRPIYSRGINPTVRTFEEMLAALEGAEDALGFASGMAAISASVLAFVAPGDRIVAVRNVYPDAFRLFGTLLPRLGVTVEYIDGRDPAAVAAALPGARLLYLESPTSWQIEALDVPALAAAAKAAGVLSIIDNSWATPVFQNPLALGVDLVVHSASKYIGGHSDVVAGVVAGSKVLVDRLRAELYPYAGGRLVPFDAWLLIRGLRTLPLRMLAHQASALALARRLAERPEVILALLLDVPFRGRGLAQALVFLPWAVPTFLTGLNWAWLFNPTIGPLPHWLHALGLLAEPNNILSDPDLALWGPITAAVWWGIPFFAITLLAALQSIPGDLYEAAAIDGANPLQRFLSITLPFLAPVIAITVLLRTVWVANFTDLIVVMTSGGPADRTQTVASYIFTQAFKRLDFGYASAISLVLLVLLLTYALLILLLRQRLIDRDK